MSVEVVTFGCRLNAFESEVIAGEAERAGLTDTIVINSIPVAISGEKAGAVRALTITGHDGARLTV